jgi:hypothetical protein
MMRVLSPRRYLLHCGSRRHRLQLLRAKYYKMQESLILADTHLRCSEQTLRGLDGPSSPMGLVAEGLPVQLAPLAPMASNPVEAFAPA